MDAEKNVLGCLLVDKTFFNNKRYSMLGVEYFGKTEHAKIFEVIQGINNKGLEVNLLSVVNELKRLKQLDFVGGASFVSKLSQNYISEAQFESFVLMLSENALRRKALNVSTTIQNLVLDEKNDIFNILDKVNELVESLNTTVVVDKTKTNNEIFGNAVKEIEKRAVTGLFGMSTGIDLVDEKMKGWGKKETHIIAGRPGMGKTTFALSAFNGMTTRHNLIGAFFTLEMSDTAIAQKLFTINGNVPSWKINTGKLLESDWDDVNRAISRLLSKNMFIFDSYFKLEEIVRKIKQMKLGLDPSENLDFVMIDYLQLISMNVKGNREQEISYISRTLKNLASELDIPIIALSQLSRAVEQRGGDKRPLLSDLRESGSLEQDASTVMFTYRPDYYGLKGENGEDLSYLAYLINAKNRNAPLCDIELFYNKDVNQEWKSNNFDYTQKPLTANKEFN